MITCPHFASHKNFLDPVKTSDGRLYAPLRYKRILQDVYFITRNTNIEYQSVMNMSVTEREYIMSFIIEEAQNIKKKNDEIQRELEQQKQQSKYSR